MNDGLENTKSDGRLKPLKKKRTKPMADYFLKILILGNTGVGKSSILSCYTDREFPKNIIGTAGIDHRVKDIMMQGKQLKI